MVNLEDLQAFYVKSQAPHAEGEAPIERRPNGGKVMTFAEGPWVMEDTFFGGDPNGGCLTIAHDGRVVWTQVYYGVIHGTQLDVTDVYDFLRLALQHPPKELPLRGPPSYVRGRLEYRCDFLGDFASYSGKESILEDGEEIFWTVLLGGLVDQRASDAD